jgi:hypothetical protein
MAPLSILPGRIRLESETVKGRYRLCTALEQRVRSIEGVIEASVNHRTGRVLVRFDENRIERAALTDLVKSTVERITPDEGAHWSAPQGKGQGEVAAADIAKGVIVDAALHVLLPRPFNLLLPLALRAADGIKPRAAG